MIEVVVALMISSVGLLSVAQLFSVTVLLNGRGRNNTGVARAAQGAFENLRAANYGSAALAATASSGSSAYYTPSHGGSFSVNTQITDVASSSGALKRIRVAVAETSTGGSGLLARGNNQAVFVSFRASAANGQYFSLSSPSTASTSPTPTPSAAATPTPTATPTVTPTPTPTPTATPTPTPPPRPTSTPTPTPTPTPSPTPRACSRNEVPATAGCSCLSPMSINQANGKCQ